MPFASFASGSSIAMLVVAAVGTLFPRIALRTIGGAPESSVEPIKDAAAVAHPEPPPPPPPYYAKLLSLRNLFDSDFSAYLWEATDDSVTRTADGAEIELPWRRIIDREAQTTFLAFYIASQPGNSASTVALCQLILDRLDEFLDTSHSVENLSPPRAGDSVSPRLKDLKFSRTIYLYIPDFLSVEGQATINAMYKTKDIQAVIRGEHYSVVHCQDDRTHIFGPGGP